MSAAVKPPGAATSTAVGNAASAASATTSAAAGDGDDTAGGFDVNRLDTAALQDVIQYSGVDLKAEAEMILRTHEASYPLANGGGATQGAGAYAREARLHHDYYFNSAPLRALISKIVCPRGITDMGEDCLDMIALAAARRLGNIVGQLAAISRERVDAGRARFKIKIENDPRRQMWLVEQYLRAEGQRVASGQGASGTGGAGSAEALARAAKLRKAERRAGEDVAVKTKLANVTAAVATGLQLKSWMTDPAALAAVLPESSSVTAGASGTGEGDGGMSGTGGSTTAAGSSGAPTLHFGQAPSMTPTSDRELQAQFAARTITLADLIHLAEGDPHLRHSNILISLYNQQRSE